MISPTRQMAKYGITRFFIFTFRKWPKPSNLSGLNVIPDRKKNACMIKLETQLNQNVWPVSVCANTVRKRTKPLATSISL